MLTSGLTSGWLPIASGYVLIVTYKHILHTSAPTDTYS